MPGPSGDPVARFVVPRGKADCRLRYARLLAGPSTRSRRRVELNAGSVGGQYGACCRPLRGLGVVGGRLPGVAALRALTPGFMPSPLRGWSCGDGGTGGGPLPEKDLGDLDLEAQ